LQLPDGYNSYHFLKKQETKKGNKKKSHRKKSPPLKRKTQSKDLSAFCSDQKKSGNLKHANSTDERSLPLASSSLFGGVGAGGTFAV
jgi:hypothetical protein